VVTISSQVLLNAQADEKDQKKLVTTATFWENICF